MLYTEGVPGGSWSNALYSGTAGRVKCFILRHCREGQMLYTQVVQGGSNATEAVPGRSWSNALYSGTAGRVKCFIFK